MWIFWVWGWVGGWAGWAGWGGWGGMVTFIATATTQYVLLHFHAAARSLALPHIRLATLLHVLLHFHTCVMLRARTACYADGCKAWKGASKQQVPEKCLKWENFAHNRGEFVKQLGGSHEKEFSLAGTRTLDKQWDWLKYT